MELGERVEAYVRANGLIEPGGAVTCLVSGGADSTCLWHAAPRARLRRPRRCTSTTGCAAADSDADAAHCAEAFGAEIVHAEPAATEAELREQRYSLTVGRGLRATGHTASDQVETVVYRLVSSGSTRGIRPRRADGVVRPLLDVWREETEAYCRAHGLTWRVDSTNADTKRGLIRERLLPLLEELDPRARANLLALASERPRLPRALEASLVELLSSSRGDTRRGSRRWCEGRPRVRHAAARGHRDVGAVAARDRQGRPRRPVAPAGRSSRGSLP